MRFNLADDHPAINLGMDRGRVELDIFHGKVGPQGRPGPAGPGVAAELGRLSGRRAMTFAHAMLAKDNSVGVLFLGDSKVEGTGLTQVAQRWQNQFMGTLRTVFPVAGGDTGYGYWPADYLTFYDLDKQPTHSAGVVPLGYDGGLGNRSVHVPVNAYVEWPNVVTGTSVRVYYTRGSVYGTMEVLVDGTVATTVNTNGANAAGRFVDVAVTAGTHTIRVRCSATNAIRPEGLYVQTSATGWHHYDGSHSGYMTTDYVQNGTTGPQATRHWESVAALPRPVGLAVIGLGANDMSSLTAAQFGANAAAMIARIEQACPRAGIVFLMGAMRVEDARSAGAGDYPGKLIEFEEALRAAIGDNPRVTILQESALWTPLNATPANPSSPVEQDPTGFLADSVHPSAFGHQQIAAYLRTQTT